MESNESWDWGAAAAEPGGCRCQLGDRRALILGIMALHWRIIILICFITLAWVGGKKGSFLRCLSHYSSASTAGPAPGSRAGPSWEFLENDVCNVLTFAVPAAASSSLQGSHT